MASISPFHGIRYNPKTCPDLGAVITPPYDVIQPQEQEEYYRRSPYNIIRLEYGQTDPGDSAADNRYTRAAAAFRQWLAEEVLIREKEKAIYRYEQSFVHNNTRYLRTGIIVALKVEPYEKKIILPHEETLTQPKSDRLELLRHCRANFSPIFGLFPDPEQRVEQICAAGSGELLYDFTDEHGDRHRLLAIKDPSLCRQLVDFLAPLPVFIADGHHRYETALNYAASADLERHPGHGYVLCTLVSLHHPGLVVLPTHRLLHSLTPAQLEKLLPLIRQNFALLEWGNLERLDWPAFWEVLDRQAQEGPAMGLLLPREVYILKAKTGEDRLDVSLLQELIFEKLLPPGQDVESCLDFTRSEEEALAGIRAGRWQAAFILRPASVEQITRMAYRGERMPQKATYFYPKLPSGLVIYHLDQSL
ncbi:MAG TPA: DUF1015 domain-containing protein [Bacillota bacterium]|jgi:uncharacterized protein (DUF1015 family)|nr:DUF1015 domain-containing protein [Bacillota bacterium]HOB87627.1 DUF1015 domain-containing protein [Bacillota bacterium]HOP68433.1 DUF1015 domain-containing protein [Bacillota bacterium]HPT33539.1 DUF1015 domain-containing protein [Bacillota bacterium]HPZ65024.1 DUF1015 domain-containing protein [Bacillota bacterium]